MILSSKLWNRSILLRQSLTVSRPWPENISESDRALFSHELAREIAACWMITLGPVQTTLGLIEAGVLSNRVLSLTHPSVGKWAAVSKPLRAAIRNSTRAPRIHSEGLWIADKWSHNYFHWVTEALPRLLLARAGGAEPQLVLPEFLAKSKFVRESLTLLGENYEVLGDRFRHKFAKLTLVSPMAPSGNPNPEVIGQLRARVRDSLMGPSREFLPKQDLRLWVSRARSRKRHIENEPALSPLLARFGFTIVYPEELSFAEQIEIFSRATVVAGLHGAGLTNIVFMASGGVVLEVRRVGDAHNNCYFALASATNQRYGYALARPLDGNLASGDCFLPELELKRALEGLLEKSSQ